MEALFQEYGDRVNFLWIYGSEAHPEEHPFSEGYESKDLGWSHPYTISLTMEERAQRALWMKTDPEPDFELPMAVDYVDHQSEPDNAIRSAYFGSGYYSSYVIGCDGVVARAHPWGWYDAGGEWWGLPLAPVDQLRDWLDDYLAAPPTCYEGEATGDPDAGVAPTPDAGATGDPDAGTGPTPDAGDDTGTGDQGGCATAGSGGSDHNGLPLPLPLPLVLVLAGLLTLIWSRRRRHGRGR